MAVCDDIRGAPRADARQGKAEDQDQSKKEGLDDIEDAVEGISQTYAAPEAQVYSIRDDGENPSNDKCENREQGESPVGL